jgi:hypothetical protein
VAYFKIFLRRWPGGTGGTTQNLVRNDIFRHSVVGIATSYWLDDRGVGVRVPAGSRIFSTSSRPVLGSTQPPIQWVPVDLSPGVKRPGREADHSPRASAERGQENLDLYIHSHIRLHAVVLNYLSTGTTLHLCYLPSVQWYRDLQIKKREWEKRNCDFLS